MPVLIPEDGTGLLAANSYISLAEADEYFSTHPYYADQWIEMGEPEREALLIRASQMIDTYIIWRGTINSVTQMLAWPRSGVYDNEGRLIASNVVPLRVKWATAELAYHLSKGDAFAPTAASAAGLESLKIDVIELQFASSVTVAPVPAAALLHLMGLGEYALGRRVRRVVVG